MPEFKGEINQIRSKYFEAIGKKGIKRN